MTHALWPIKPLPVTAIPTADQIARWKEMGCQYPDHWDEALGKVIPCGKPPAAFDLALGIPVCEEHRNRKKANT